MAILATVGLGMELMAECGRSHTFEVEGDLLGFQPLVAAVAVGGYGECFLAVMTGAAGPAIFHLRHGHGFFLAGYDLAIVTALAGSAGFCNMGGMTEYRLAQALDVVGYLTGFALVAADAIFFSSNAERFNAAVACSA